MQMVNQMIFLMALIATFGSDASYFTTLELGWTASQDLIYRDNFHVTFLGLLVTILATVIALQLKAAQVSISHGVSLSRRKLCRLCVVVSQKVMLPFTINQSLLVWDTFGLGKPTNNLRCCAKLGGSEWRFF